MRILITTILATLLANAAHAQSGDAVRIGVLNDMSGVYSDDQGPGSVIAAQMAVEDYGGKVAGKKVEVLSADHQNKTDIGAQVARRWFDEGVGVIVDVPNSAIALAVSELARDKNKVLIGSGAGTSLLTGEKCSPNTVHWTYDTWAYGHGLASAVAQQNVRSVYFITADYAFGHDLEKQFADEFVKQGGRVLGSARHPIGTNDFSSLVLQAQGSKADAVAFANAGGDTSNSLKQAAEFGLGQQQKLLALIMGQNNVRALGLPATQGIMQSVPFYWDMNDQTRAFAQHSSAQSQEAHAQRHACWCLRLGAALSESRRQGGQRRRWQGSGCGHESDPDRRSAIRQRHDPRRRPQAASHVLVPGESSGTVEGALGRVQTGGNDPRRSGFPSAQRRRMPASQAIARRPRGCSPNLPFTKREIQELALRRLER